MKILIATEGSEFSEVALSEAGLRPWPVGSELRVLAVNERSVLTYVNAGEVGLLVSQEAIFAAVRKLMEGIAKSGAEKLAAPGRTISYLVHDGFAAEEILEEAKSWDADVIFVGTHGRSGVVRFLLGSVAQRVATYAHCSVVIVRKKV